MDNVTHTLAGLLLAQAAVRIRARRTGTEPSPRFKSIAAVSSLVAANIPDADLFYTGVGADRLAYMLHHRGHTHTVLIALLGGALVWGVVLLLWRWRAHRAPPRDDRYWLLGLLLVSAMSHLTLDWTNSYGIHAFWPFDNAWRYGDSVFIIEPWLWAASVPTLVAGTTSRIARVLLSLVLVVGLGLAWSIPLVSMGAAAMLTLGCAGFIALARILRPGPRTLAATAGWLAVTLVMVAGTTTARASVTRAVHAADPTATLLDVVVSPLPANAVCADVITVERDGPIYRVVRARVSAAPRITEARGCGARFVGGDAFRSSARPSSPAVQWEGEWTAPAAELAALARESCVAHAALRFIRVPIWHVVGDSTIRLADVRFGGGSGDGMFHVDVTPRAAQACPDAIPPWIPPRADLLD